MSVHRDQYLVQLDSVVQAWALEHQRGLNLSLVNLLCPSELFLYCVFRCFLFHKMHRVTPTQGCYED